MRANRSPYSPAESATRLRAATSQSATPVDALAFLDLVSSSTPTPTRSPRASGAAGVALGEGFAAGYDAGFTGGCTFLRTSTRGVWIVISFGLVGMIVSS